MPQDVSPSQAAQQKMLSKQGPSMRAPTKMERAGNILRSVYEGAAQQPIVRIADMLGLSDIGGIVRNWDAPPTMKHGAMPAGPFKLGNKSIQLLDDAIGPAANASGESMASIEALNRMKGMKNRGERYVVRRGGTTRDLIGPEAVDYSPRPGEEYGVMGSDNLFRLLQRGGR